MATISNTPRPGYVYDSTDAVWYPIGTGSHNHSEIPSTIVDAKGDIITASAADTPARLAVGNNGETLVADSSTSTGLRWQGDFTAGKNKIINGDMNINQRGFSSSTSSSFPFDRFDTSIIGGTCTQTAQTFTLGTAPVAGYEAKNFFQVAITGQSASGDAYVFTQKIESVRTLANQAATISFWAKATSGTPAIAVELSQNFGTGGSPSSAVNTGTTKQTISTSWTRYTYSITVPSISGKTLGSNNNDYLALNIWLSAGSTFNSRTDTLGVQNNTFQLWGVQVEAGSVATAFQTATGTLQGELAACQRYFYREESSSTGSFNFGTGTYYNTTDAYLWKQFPVQMRGNPTFSSTVGGLLVYANNASKTPTGLTLSQASKYGGMVTTTGITGATGGWACIFQTLGTSNTILDFSAEL